jgi:transposase InsO family protein
LPVAENVLAREFTVARPNQVWTSDITYVWTTEGWLYLAVFLDLYSRLVVGWAVSERLTTEFVERAFGQAQQRRGQADHRWCIVIAEVSMLVIRSGRNWRLGIARKVCRAAATVG